MAPRTDMETFSELVREIYRTAYDDANWMRVFELLTRATDVRCLQLHGYDLEIGEKELSCLSGYDQSFVDSYVEHYWRENVWLRGVMESPVGVAVAAEKYCAERDLVKSEFYNEWVLPQDDLGTGGGLLIYRDGQRFLSLGGNIRLRDRERLQHNWLRTLDLIAPHIQAAFETRRRLSGVQLADQKYLAEIERIEGSVFLLSANGRIVHANTEAEQLLRTGEIAFVDRQGQLRLRRRNADRTLSERIRETARFGVCATGTDLDISAEEAPETRRLSIGPFHADAEKTGLLDDFVGCRRPVVIVAITRNAAPERTLAKVLESRYGLTPAETRLTLALWQGSTLNDYADRNHISRHTVRNQVKSVFFKTGAHRQSVLVAQVTRIANGG